MSGKKVGLLAAISVIVGNAVGSGIFTTTGFLARDVGNPLVILMMWVTAGVVVLCGVLTYYRLHLKWPESGGEFVYITKGFGPLAGFLSGWASFVFGFGAAIAASAISFGYFFDSAVSSFIQLDIATDPAIQLLSDKRESESFKVVNPSYLAVGLVLLVTYCHSKSVSLSGQFQFFLTLLKVVFILTLFLFGMSEIYQDYTSTDTTTHVGYFEKNFVQGSSSSVSFSDIAVGMVFIMYAYSGWNAANYISEEIENPKKNMLTAMVVSTLSIVVLYVFLNIVYLSALPVSELAAAPIVPVAEKALRALLGEGVSIAFCAMLCVSIVSSISAMVWVGPRVYLKMAQYSSKVPKRLASKNNQGVPVNAMWAQTVWAVLLCLSGTVENILLFSGLPLLLFSLLAVCSSFQITFPDDSLFKFLFYRACSLIFIVCVLFSIFIVFKEKPLISIISILVLSLGALVYFFSDFRALIYRNYNN